MMLASLLTEVGVRQLVGPSTVEVRALADDSRQVSPESLYVAVCGLRTDGHLYINDAIDRGAKAIVCERLPKTIRHDRTYIVVGDSADALGMIAAAFYNHPSRRMQVIGITGTDGKTTTATLLHHIATACGYKAGLMSTIRNVIVDQSTAATYTTLAPLQLQRTLSQMADAGCNFVFMEVSSHAVTQRRISGITFRGGIFTNLTECHLDYHRTMEAYFMAKQRFFQSLSSRAFALTNVDDVYGREVVRGSPASSATYALNGTADYCGSIQSNTLTGLQCRVNNMPIYTGLVGRFNAYNVTAAFGASQLLGFDPMRVSQALATANPVEGRFDWVAAQDGRIGVVDYAHTANALTNLIDTCRHVFPDRRIIMVLGCQGEPHDKAKRPVLGQIAADTDCAIFTTMNPRHEPPNKIVLDMLTGVAAARRSVVRLIPDRLDAIRRACELALPDGVVVVAGRGHVRHHLVGQTLTHFSDKDILLEAFRAPMTELALSIATSTIPDIGALEDTAPLVQRNTDQLRREQH